MSMKFTPMTVWRIWISVGPGGGTSRSTAFSTSAPPTACISIASIIIFIAVIEFELSNDKPWTRARKFGKCSLILCESSQMFDWQDLRVFAVLARLGSLSAAARELGVDHATVGRRVASLETELGLRLIDRLPRSCPLTTDGVAIAGLAEQMEPIARQVQRRARGAASPLAGAVRISAPPALAARCIAPHIANLRQLHPELRIVLQATPSLTALDRGEADIALRLSRPTGNGAVARRIGALPFGVYANAQYATRPPEEWEFIAYDEALDHVPQQAWLRRYLKGRTVAFEASDLFGQKAAVRSGAGVAVLPTIMADDDQALVRIEASPEPPKRDLWLVTYPDLRRSPAVRAVLKFLVDCIEREPCLRR
jgi:DNA-binding transcriptional LysR family regulator